MHTIQTVAASMAFDARKRSCISNWSDLYLDVLVSIANRMDLVEDFIAFGLVCKPWRLAAPKENFTAGLSHQVPWMLLHPTAEGNIADNSIADFYNMRKEKTHRLSLAAESKRNEVHSSSLGWLITVSEDLEVSLLHPLNHHPIVKLPRFPTKRRSHRMFDSSHPILKCALSSSPSSTSDYIVMAIYYDGGSRLAFCRPGDDRWTIVAGEKPDDWYHDVTYYKGQFYIVDNRGCVLVCDIEDSGEAKTRVIIDQSVPLRHRNRIHRDVSYSLVESSGVLLAVQQVSFGQPIKFRVFEVPFSTGNWSHSKVKDLGSRTLFLDGRCLISVEASTHSSCEKNCIYYIDQSFCRTDNRAISIFSMADSTIRTNRGGFSGSQIPHLWIQPSL